MAPIFTVTLQDRKNTIIGYDRIEVLAIIPLRQAPLEDPSPGQEGVWLVESGFLCRTESGITVMHQDDLLNEIATGVYCEPGKQTERVAHARRKRLASFRCPDCDEPLERT